MKSILLLLLTISILFVSGCTQEVISDEGFSTTVNGQDIIILFNEGTKSEGIIISEKGTYTFSYGFDGSLTVVYPNGYTYTIREMTGVILSSWCLNEPPEELGFIDIMSLQWAVTAASQASRGNQRSASPIISILLLGVGLFWLLSPKSVWWLCRGWMFKNAEPSDLALGAYRIIGIVIALIGIISIFAM